jgi:outer membrane lipoprotein SlyB
VSAFTSIESTDLALVSGGTDWRLVRQAAVIGAGIGAAGGAAIGGIAGAGVFSAPGAAIGALAGAGVGAATTAVQAWAMQRYF